MNEFQPAHLLPLLRREWQEHRGLFGWTQLGVLVFVIVLILLILAFGSVADVQSIAQSTDGDVDTRSRFDGSLLTLMTQQFTLFSDLPQQQKATMLSHARLGVATLFQLALLLSVLFYLSGALHDDRKDHSVLFWKSMPVSDAETVISKLLMALFVAPAVAVVAMFLGQLAFFIIATFLAWGAGVSAWDTLWAPSGLLSGLAILIAGYMLQALWALPLYGWILMVSAFASRAPLLWVILVPVLIYIVERVVFGVTFIGRFFYDHLRGRGLPQGFADEQDATQTWESSQALVAFLTSVDLWIGVVIGFAFVVGAIVLRRQYNEI